MPSNYFPYQPRFQSGYRPFPPQNLGPQNFVPGGLPNQFPYGYQDPNNIAVKVGKTKVAVGGVNDILGTVLKGAAVLVGIKILPKLVKMFTDAWSGNTGGGGSTTSTSGSTKSAKALMDEAKAKREEAKVVAKTDFEAAKKLQEEAKQKEKEAKEILDAKN